VTEGSGNHDATAAANQAASTNELRGGSTAAKIEFGVVAAIALVLAGHVFWRRSNCRLRGWMRERCWFIPEQVLKGKLPYRDSETFYGPPNPFLLAVV